MPWTAKDLAFVDPTRIVRRFGLRRTSDSPEADRCTVVRAIVADRIQIPVTVEHPYSPPPAGDDLARTRREVLDTRGANCHDVNQSGPTAAALPKHWLS